MKSLKEFIAENLENPTAITAPAVSTIQENTEKQVDENNNLEEGQEETKPNEELAKEN